MRLWPLLLASCAAPQPVATDLDAASPSAFRLTQLVPTAEPSSTGQDTCMPQLATGGAGEVGSIPAGSTILNALGATGERILAAAVAPWLPDRVMGSVQVIHGRTHCEVADLIGVLPMVWPSNVEPVVGVEWRCEWTTLAMGASREWPAVVLASVQDNERPPSIDLTPFGLQGCWLHVDLSRVLWLWPGPADSIVHRPVGDEGRVIMRWTPTADYLGKTVVAQLVVVVPRDVAQSGFLLSPGLSITAGRR